MTANQFLTECLSVSVAPSIALENESIVAALESRDDAEVRRILKEEF